MPRHAAHRIASTAVVVIAVLLGACSGDDDATTAAESAATAQPDVAPTDPSSVDPTADPADGTTPPDATVAPTPPPVDPATTPPVVATIVLGGIVGGSSGGVGEGSTDSASEVVRNEDGSCSGWDGRRGGGWTSEIQSGAPFSILDAVTGEVLGTGTLATSWTENVASGGDEQWQCWFPFEVEASRPAEQYAVQVGGNEPWVLAPNPQHPGELLAPIDTPIDPGAVSGCEGGELPPSVSEWSSVGQYWNNGMSSLCFAGLTIGAIRGSCSPPGIAADRIVSVAEAEHREIVYEDAQALLVDPSAVAPGTAVVVTIATGVPCG